MLIWVWSVLGAGAGMLVPHASRLNTASRVLGTTLPEPSPSFMTKRGDALSKESRSPRTRRTLPTHRSLPLRKRTVSRDIHIVEAIVEA